MSFSKSILTTALVGACALVSAQTPGKGADWMKYVKSGSPLTVAMDVPFDAMGQTQPLGDIKPGQIYTVSYKNGSFTATGYHIGVGGTQTMTYGLNPDAVGSRHRISIWGRQFLLTEDGSVVDFTFGKVGTAKVKTSLLDRIRNGASFKITFDLCDFDDSGNPSGDPMGDAKAGETYTGRYDRGTGNFTFTGFHEGQNQVTSYIPYNNADLNKYQISLWGRGYRFDEFGYVYDPEYGMVGHLTMLSTSTSAGQPGLN